MYVRAVLAGVALLVAGVAAAEDPSTKNVEWPQYGGSQGFDRYSPLDLINTQNVKGLKILWTRPALDPSLTQEFPTLKAGRISLRPRSW